MTTAAERVPLTVLTGFLGAGKTPLLNHCLTANHGKRIAVLESELGEVGVNQDLVVTTEEEICEMNDGCMCFTVRGDLIRMQGTLMKRRDRFDDMLVETTGMTDPGPVASTFFVVDESRSKTRLDGLVPLVDSMHVHHHWQTNEVQEQIAFTDLIMLDKTDLVEHEEVDALEARISAMNVAAKIDRTRNCVIEMDRILNVVGFDLDLTMLTEPHFLEPEYPFEWGGVFALDPGDSALIMQGGPVPAIQLALQPATDGGLPLTPGLGRKPRRTRQRRAALPIHVIAPAWSRDDGRLAVGTEVGEVVVYESR